MKKDLMDPLIDASNSTFVNDNNIQESPTGVPQAVKRICDLETDQLTEMSAPAKAMQTVQNPDLSSLNNNEVGAKPEETSLGKKQFSCKSCDYFARNKVDVVLHFKKFHMDRFIEDRSKVQVIQCSSCTMIYTDQRRLSMHKRVCKEIINKAKDDLSSQGSVDDKTLMMFQCAQCDFKTRYGGKFKAHLYNRHPVTSPLDNEVQNIAHSISISDTGDKLQLEVSGTIQEEGRSSKDPVIRVSPKANKKSSPKIKTPLIKQVWNCSKCKFSTKSEKVLSNHVTKKHPELTKTPVAVAKESKVDKTSSKISKIKRMESCPCCSFKTPINEKFSTHLIQHYPNIIPILNATSTTLSRRMNLCYQCPFCHYNAINHAKYSKHLAKYHIPEHSGKKNHQQMRATGKKVLKRKGQPKKEKQELTGKGFRQNAEKERSTLHEAEVLTCSKCSQFTVASLQDVALHYKTCSGPKAAEEETIRNGTSNKLHCPLEPSNKENTEESGKEEVTKPNLVQCKNCSFTTSKLVLLAMHFKKCATKEE